VITLVVAVVGFSYLQGSSIFETGRQFYAVYDRVDGLSQDNYVQLNGYNIGKVNSIKLHSNGSGKIVVGFRVTNNTVKVTDKTVARISSLDLFGSKAITLQGGMEGTPAKAGDTLKSAIEGDLKAEVDKRLQPLEKKTNDLIGSIDSVVTIVQAILNEDARTNLTQSFESINRSFRTFETTLKRVDTLVISERQKFDTIVSNMNSIVSNIEGNNERIDTILRNFSSISDSLVKADLVGTIDKAGTAMESVASVMKKIDEGKGSAGLLVNNDTLYRNLESATLELDKLLEDMRVNPKRYVHFSVFGRKEKPAEKPKKKER
jgi:phospholipid/cholesterol/gamma-HCH transport system substrate-binding protein